jgi:UV DNA damage endonuclease
MIKRIGWACKYVHPDQSLSRKQLAEVEQPMNTRSTTLRWLSNQTPATAEQRMWEIAQHNVASALRLVEYAGAMVPERRMVRLSSDLCPMYTHPSWATWWQKADVQAMVQQEFAKIGEAARRLDVRLSFHPGQFVALASDRPDVVTRSIAEFEYHADMIRWMGYGKKFQDFKCNVHISGKQGPAGIKAALKLMTPEARNCITIENAEYTWGIDASLELAKDCALVLDVHHHLLNSIGEYIQPTDNRVHRMWESWRGVRPVIHYSISREAFIGNTPGLPDIHQMVTSKQANISSLRAHSDWYPNAACNDWILEFWQHADIVCEAKQKNLAAQQLYNYSQGIV